MSISGPDGATAWRRRRTPQHQHAFLEPNVEGFFCVDPKGRCAFASESVGRMLGYEPGEMLGADARILEFHACQADTSDPGLLCPVHATLRTGGAYRAEHAIFRREDGSPLYAGCSSQPIIEGGEARGAAVTIVGPGESQRTEELDSRWAAMLEATTDFVGMADTDGRVLFVNRAGREMVGVGVDEDLSGTAIVSYHPRWAAEVVLGEGVPTALREGTWSGETALLSHDGREIPVSQVILAHRTLDGKVRFLSTTARDITGRKRLFEESERRAAELDAVIRAIPDAVYVGDASGIRICNDAALEMLGFGSIAELNQSVDILSNRLQNRFAATGQRIPVEEEPFVRALRGETVVEEVISCHLGTGHDVIVRCAAAPVLREGEIIGAVAVNTDITGRKHVEERLRYQARLLENVQDAVIATDEQLVVKAWNRAAEEMYGWKAEEALERCVGEVIHPELNEEQTSEARRELIETGWSRNELITHRKDGAAVYIEGVTAALRGEQGQITDYLSINRDVTERKEAEEALQESYRRIENILESFSDAFFAVDREWRFTYINERALRRMQRTGGVRQKRPEPRREDFLGKNLWEEFPGLVGTVFERRYREVRREQRTAEFEAHYPPADKWFDVHAYPSEEGLSVYFQEITERKRVEQTLLEIREGERRRIARDLHDVVLQDLAAALQAVQATLVRSREPHEELVQATDTIRRTARSLRGVIHDLRLEEGQPFVKAVEALVADLDQQSECEVGLEVENGFPQELPGEVGIGLLRIVREALANARRHSGARRVVVTLSSEAGWVEVEVFDDGRGFDPATVEGSSFGLWGMKERVRELGAKLEMRSAPGEGTRVSVKAPAGT